MQRPAAYFSVDRTCPEELSLVVERPPIRTDDRGPRDGWFQRVRGLIARNVRVAKEEMRSLGGTFLGRDAVLSTSFVRRAKSYEEKRGLIATFAAKLPSVREMLAAVERGFRIGYRRALVAWCEGVRDVLFPYGTWGMRVLHRALVEPPLRG